MIIETPTDIAEKMADWLGIYGCCDSEKCQEDLRCCRNMFVSDMEERIRASVVNEQRLEAAGLS